MFESFPLDDVFSETLKRYFPKGIETLEDVALASYQDIPVKKGYEYIWAARRYLARMVLEKIRREKDEFVVTVRAGIEYPEDYAVKLYSVIALPYIGVYDPGNVQFLRKEGREYRYKIQFQSEYYKQLYHN